MRLFFAATPDDEIRERLADAVLTLGLDEFSRRVPPENYHMTLAFIGETTEAQLAAMQAIGAARAGSAPGSSPQSGGPKRSRTFPVVLDRFEHWPQAEAVVARIGECSPVLETLSLSIRSDLLRRRLIPDPKPFRPHVTVARKVSQAPVFKAMSRILWTVREFHLMRSDRSARGAVYTVVDTWQLLDTGSTEP